MSSKTTNCAPIVLFVYNRADHASRTIEALKTNRLARQSILYIYSDASKSEKDVSAVQKVRDLIANVDGFKDVIIKRQVANIGLAASIIDGVTEVISQYGSVIVLEDDIVTAPHFLEFMNNALVKYQREKSVWHLAGWNYPISGEDLGDAFFWRTMNCWGWATWSDRWQHFEKNPKKLKSKWNREQINRFNLDGSHNFWGQVELNISSKINTWAIFWYATIFEHNGLCLHPTDSLVENIGMDGSGTHCGSTDQFKYSLNSSAITSLPDTPVISDIAEQRIKEFYIDSAPGILERMLNKIKLLLKY